MATSNRYDEDLLRLLQKILTPRTELACRIWYQRFTSHLLFRLLVVLSVKDCDGFKEATQNSSSVIVIVSMIYRNVDKLYVVRCNYESNIRDVNV